MFRFHCRYAATWTISTHRFLLLLWLLILLVLHTCKNTHASPMPRTTWRTKEAEKDKMRCSPSETDICRRFTFDTNWLIWFVLKSVRFISPFFYFDFAPDFDLSENLCTSYSTACGCRAYSLVCRYHSQCDVWPHVFVWYLLFLVVSYGSHHCHLVHVCECERMWTSECDSNRSIWRAMFAITLGQNRTDGANKAWVMNYDACVR